MANDETTANGMNWDSFPPIMDLHETAVVLRCGYRRALELPIQRVSLPCALAVGGE
jgi:hypothetical protein